MHFNQLTPKEAELLAMLSEESGEVVQSVAKTLRHGLESFNPRTDITNRSDIRSEIIDLMAVVELLIDAGVLDPATDAEIDAAVAKRLRYTHHQ